MSTTPPLRCHCTHCGWQFAGYPSQALELSSCEQCGNHGLVLTTAVAETLGVDGVPGESLWEWLDRYRYSLDASRSGSVDASVYAQRATSAASNAYAPQPRMPGRGNPASRPVSPSAPSGVPTPRRRTPMPPPQKSGSGVVIGLVIGGVVFLIAIAGVALALTATPTSPPRESQASSNTSDRTKMPQQTPQPAPYDPLDAATKQMKADAATQSKALRSAHKTMVESEAAVVGGLNKLASAVDAKIADATSSRDKEKRALGDFEDAATSASKKHATEEAKLKTLRNSQSPLLAFVGAYEAVVEAITTTDELALEVEDKRTQVHQHRIAIDQAERDVLDLEAASQEAESPSDRASANLAMNEAHRRMDQYEDDLDVAEDALGEAELALVRKESEVNDLSDEVVELRNALDESDPQVATVLDSIKAFEAALLKKGRAITTLRLKQKELERILNTTDDPYRRYLQRKSEYWIAHKERLAADRKVSSLERDYLENGGGSAAKENIRRAKAVADSLEEVEKAAKKKLREAEDEVDTQDDLEDDAVDAVTDAREVLLVAAEAVTGRQVSLDEAFADVRKTSGPEEERRQKQVTALTKVVAELKATLDAALLAEDRQRVVVNRLSENLRGFEADREWIESAVTAIYDDGAAVYVKELADRLDALAMTELISLSDAESLAELASEAAFELDSGALGAGLSTDIRVEHADDIDLWANSVRAARAAAAEVESSSLNYVIDSNS